MSTFSLSTYMCSPHVCLGMRRRPCALILVKKPCAQHPLGTALILPGRGEGKYVVFADLGWILAALLTSHVPLGKLFNLTEV